jgi:CBS domain-containing protein
MAKTVADVMSRDPIMVKPQTPIKEAIKILQNSASVVCRWWMTQAVWWA